MSEAAERLHELWRQGQRPDLDAFLGEPAGVLREDRRQRWRAGERVGAALLRPWSPLLVGVFASVILTSMGVYFR